MNLSNLGQAVPIAGFALVLALPVQARAQGITIEGEGHNWRFGSGNRPSSNLSVDRHRTDRQQPDWLVYRAGSAGAIAAAVGVLSRCVGRAQAGSRAFPRL